MTISPMHMGARDFDFFFGSWHIANERLKSRLTKLRRVGAIRGNPGLRADPRRVGQY